MTSEYGLVERADLVVDEVEQLQDVHLPNRDLALVRLARAAVEEAAPGRPTARRQARRLVETQVDAAVLVLLLPLHQRLVDLLDLGPVEHGRRHVDAAVAVLRLLVGVGAVVVPAVRRDPPEMRLEDLADVHGLERRAG